MKKIAILLAIISFQIQCSDDETITPNNNLFEDEKKDLKFSREEEKLAHDVYLFSYEKYGQLIFNNIAKSEQQHMDQILVLLKLYQIEDPSSPETGKFSDINLQNLYNDLIALSNISLMEALKVGVLIEDLDIYDLNMLASRTDKSDILEVYNSLECGSRNHLRNFYSQLQLNVGDYTPEFISLEDFNSIINSPNEKCGK